MSGALSHRRYVLAELRSSEREYVERLRVATEDYLGYVQSEETVPAELKADALAIFCNLPDIYTFHKHTFLPALEACSEDVEAITQCFLTHKTKFSIYMQYCKNKPTSDSARAEHDVFFRQRQTALGHKLNIEDFLIAPVQRFTKYQLLLRDLLKDTQKANEDTSTIQEALQLMKQIPKETNNIICISLLRGIHRSRLVGHGSLWLQDQLLFWSDKTHGGVKAEPRQVFLFDHRILVALLPNSDGFFDYQLDIKTLQGSVQTEIKGEPFRFGFTTASKAVFYFQATSDASKAEWVSALHSILTSQSQIMKALVFGKPVTPKPGTQHHSMSVDWNDSDSSVDSVCSSASSSSGDPDWPSHTGFEPLTQNRTRTVPHPSSPTLPSLSLSLPPSITHSASFSTTRELSQKRRSMWSATLSPNLLSRWRHRRASERRRPSMVSMPVIPAQKKGVLRSPGSLPRSAGSFLAMNTLLVAKESVSMTEPMTPGQLAVPLDTSLGDWWQVHLLSGPRAGQEVRVQRESVEEHNTPVSWLPISQTHNFKKEVGRGRFSKVRKAKHKATGVYHAVKVLRSEVPDEAFHHELCVAFRLSHPNIVRCFGGIANGNERAITLELVKGRLLLEHLVQKSSTTDAEVSALLAQLLDALSYLHSRTICHLDCRPDNVIVHVSQGKEIVKLVDFGAARYFGTSRDNLPLEHSYESPASYQYLPPEAFQHQPLGPTADIWAVGVTTFVIFHGYYPFAGDKEAATISNIIKGSYHLPNEGACSHNVRHFIRATLTHQHSERPSATEAKEFKWFKEDHSSAGPGPWQVQLAHIKQFLSRHGQHVHV